MSSFDRAIGDGETNHLDSVILAPSEKASPARCASQSIRFCKNSVNSIQPRIDKFCFIIYN
jgi:hypothetical protein